MQVCTSCGEEKPLSDFYKKGKKKTGYRTQCKRCIGGQYIVNQERIRQRNVARMYNISLAEYDDMLETQGYACAICSRSAEDNGMRLSVDHDHTTGMVRGLLCITCNQGIGCFRDNTKLLNNAILYLNTEEKFDE